MERTYTSSRDPVSYGAPLKNIVKVLVVDDSAYVRKVVSKMLTRSPFIEIVGVARDGAEALELAEERDPDVITCDLNMPQMDGVAFVTAQMARRAVPIVIISVAGAAGEEVLAALDAGAIDYLQKPTALASDRLMDMADQLIEKVKAAALSPMRRATTSLLAPAGPLPVLTAMPGNGRLDVAVIGISTGGPQGLKQVIPRLPANFAIPVGIVLHMPVGYTEIYAKKLDEISELGVKEAAEGDLVEPGMVLLAPAGRHMSFRRVGGQVLVHLDVRPLDRPHRPSVDVLFHSAAEVFGSRTLGVVMTGMGSDGRDGAAWIKARGGRILTEAEESCVVYGMPRAVDEAGLSDRKVPISGMAEAIMEQL
jgi:two-component system, chemotaxis family, protein-glutamate methylesterase/glutaminase